MNPFSPDLLEIGSVMGACFHAFELIFVTAFAGF
jgi:hypothetical protein